MWEGLTQCLISGPLLAAINFPALPVTFSGTIVPRFDYHNVLLHEKPSPITWCMHVISTCYLNHGSVMRCCCFMYLSSILEVYRSIIHYAKLLSLFLHQMPYPSTSRSMQISFGTSYRTPYVTSSWPCIHSGNLSLYPVLIDLR